MNLELVVVISFVIWLNICLYFKVRRSSKTIFLVILLLLAFYALIYKNPIVNIVYFLFLLTSFIGAIVGILGDRKYLYLISLIFFILIPVLIFFNLDKYAEFLGAVVFLILCLGFFRDTLYEKIFN